MTEPQQYPPMKVVRVNRTLSCLLTEAERLARGKELADAYAETGREADRQKSAKTQMKARLEELEARTSRLADVVTTGEEMREVLVERRYDYVGAVVVEVRTDTGEQIEIRQMDDHERQMALPNTEPETNDETDEDAAKDDQDDEPKVH